MQEDKKIEVHAVQRVHFVPRPDGGLGFALVIETQDKGILGFALPLPALVQIFELLPKIFADLLRTKPLTGVAVPENMTYVYWDSMSSLLTSQSIPAPANKAATSKSAAKKTLTKPAKLKVSAKSAPSKKATPKFASKAASKTKSVKK